MKQWSVSLFGAVAAVSIILAAATVWLIVTDPVTVATAVNQGDISPLVQDLAQVILDAVYKLLSYL